MTTKKSPAMFYIRIQKPDGHFHRVGCVVMKRVNATHTALGWSMCNPKDNFIPYFANHIALNRLENSPTIIKNSLIEEEFIENLIKAFKGFPDIYMYGNGFYDAYDKNTDSMMGAYQNLFPKSKSKV